MAKTEATKQGTAVVLPNKQRRVDYIRAAYYGDAVKGGTHNPEKHKSRSDIRNAINEMLEKAGRKDEQIPYQIVFAATKKLTWAPAAKPAAKAETKAKK